MHSAIALAFAFLPLIVEEDEKEGKEQVHGQTPCQRPKKIS